MLIVVMVVVEEVLLVPQVLQVLRLTEGMEEVVEVEDPGFLVVTGG